MEAHARPRAAEIDICGTGTAFGTFGELLQGVLPGDDRHFMVTFPVAGWSRAVFRHSPGHQGFTVWPPHKRKAVRIAELALAAAGRTGGGSLELSSELPEGKGMASSSADLVATVRAVGAAVGTTFAAAEIESFMRKIEPTDGVMYDQIVAYHHREAELREELGMLPPVVIVGHDEGGQVDTIAHNRQARVVGEAEKAEYAVLLAELCEAVRGQDLRAVGRVATRSAELNAAARSRRSLPELQRICADTGGLGVACAHSGTVLGILYAADDPELAVKVGSALSACAALPGTTTVHRSLGRGDVWSASSLEVTVRESTVPAREASTETAWGA
ncbi:GHMP family kinase ATP-binding protein [Streptomyces vinaceus]|uniref:GHMP family kinase ATP-binding protein n=1 Tax=Streptomyces vinaceus TaxID=1960 RepID=UPI0010497496|nr:kinase [Streptomyces vinaceus]GHE73704.1 kinase [Streptomyces vinaceus]